MLLLKQSTGTKVSFGPFVSVIDNISFKTNLVSALDNATTGIKISRNGDTLKVRHAAVTASIYDSYGNYRITLDTTDTNTLGILRIQYGDTSCHVVWQDFTIVPSNVYNSIVMGTDYLQTDTTQISGDSVAGQLATTANISDAVRDEVIEGSYTLGQLVRLMSSALFAKVSGGGTATITFRNLGDSANRIVTSVDSNGNRTSITLTP